MIKNISQKAEENIEKKAENNHQPVLLKEVLEYSKITQNELNSDKKNESESEKESLKIFDGTLGGGGYSSAFLKNNAFNDTFVWACDLDKNALKRSKKRFLQENLATNYQLKQTSFCQYIQEFEDNFFDVIVLDLGYSSNQLEIEEKGFSYLKKDQILDLRFNENEGFAAWQKLQNCENPVFLRDILYRYSGEKLSAKIANSIIEFAKKRENKSIPWKVAEIVEIICEVIPRQFSKKTSSILSRIWQALRIWTNNEFENLEKFLPQAILKLKPNGRLVIVSFHSLEDKLVTNFLRKTAKPLVVDAFGNCEQSFKLITKKAITPSLDEINQNPRSRSAILRCLEKLEEN